MKNILQLIFHPFIILFANNSCNSQFLNLSNNLRGSFSMKKRPYLLKKDNFTYLERKWLQENLKSTRLSKKKQHSCSMSPLSLSLLLQSSTSNITKRFFAKPLINNGTYNDNVCFRANFFIDLKSLRLAWHIATATTILHFS